MQTHVYKVSKAEKYCQKEIVTSKKSPTAACLIHSLQLFVIFCLP